MPQRFNRQDRLCPMCYRQGEQGLAGKMADGATVQCRGCANVFRVDGATLERLPVAHPTGRPLTHAEVGERYREARGLPPFEYRAPLRVDDPCKVCGQKHCMGHAEERLS